MSSIAGVRLWLAAGSSLPLSGHSRRPFTLPLVLVVVSLVQTGADIATDQSPAEHRQTRAELRADMMLRVNVQSSGGMVAQC